MVNPKHVARVRRELEEAGVTRYGFMKLSTRAVPEIIRLDERIGGAVYGRVNSGSAMLIATDQRIIFIDRKPFFSTSDELTYDVVSGVQIHTAGPFCTVVLHTRINDYKLRYVNENCAKKFVQFIENRRINPGSYDQHTGRFTHNDDAPASPYQSSEGAASFIRSHRTGVLATANNNRVHSSVVHYYVDDQDYIYIATTPDSRKVQYIANNPLISLTIFEVESEITVRVEGTAAIEQNQDKIREAASELRKQNTVQIERFTQNVSAQQSQLVIIKIDPRRTELTNYRKK